LIDELWPGGPCFAEAAGVFRLGTDSVLLAHFAKTVRAKGQKYAIDLGCGSGIISVLFAWSNPELVIDGVEIDPRAAALAAENAALNKMPINVIEGDLRRHREFLTAGAYDLAVSNPPYFAQGRGKTSQELALARGEESCTLSDICRAAGYVTRWGGAFALVHKPERLREIFSALSESGFEPKRLRFVQHMNTSPPSLVLIESRRGGNPSLKVEPPLILANNDGGDSDEVKAIYHR